MRNSSSTKRKVSKGDTDFFNILEKTQSQYEEYVKLAGISPIETEEDPYMSLKRDINHPLTLVIC